MSALTEKVAREHHSPLGLSCACGHRPGRRESMIDTRTRHLIAVTEAAVRAAVAADIRAARAEAIERTPDHLGLSILRGRLAGLEQAAQIAEGED